MKFKNLQNSLVLISLFSATIAMAQHQFVNTPPEISPMPMKPEMTEIWEPEVKTIIPAKMLGNAPSDAIILFDGKNLDQWVSKKDANKPATWKIIDNDYMEIVPGSGDIQTKMALGAWRLSVAFGMECC